MTVSVILEAAAKGLAYVREKKIRTYLPIGAITLA